MVPRDTAPDAWARHIDDLRTIRPEARLWLAIAASDDMRELARAGIRHRHPEWDDARVQDGFEAMMLGEGVAQTAREGRPTARR
jgi:hypothetical protein